MYQGFPKAGAIRILFDLLFKQLHSTELNTDSEEIWISTIIFPLAVERTELTVFNW